MDLVAGQTLGRYEITGYLGAGGMIVVFPVFDTPTGRRLAVDIVIDRISLSRIQSG